MIGYGVHPSGLNSLVSASLYRKVIIPTILYGSELWSNMSDRDVISINKTQHYIVKCIQGFPTQTRSDICESMLGLNRLSSEVEKRKLFFLHKILTLPNDSITKGIFLRRYYKFLQYPSKISKGFIPDIAGLLSKYHLTHLLNDYLMQNSIPSKYAWKKLVLTRVHHHEQTLWQTRTDIDRDFERFKNVHKTIKPAVLWTFPKTRRDLGLSHLIAQVWISRPDSDIFVCGHCEQITTDKIRHITADCLLTSQLKDEFMATIDSDLNEYGNGTNDIIHDSELFLQFLLGTCITEDMSDEMSYEILFQSYSYIQRCMSLYYNLLYI